MVELGTRQRTENEAFAGAAARLAATLVVVGRTNLAALRRGGVPRRRRRSSRVATQGARRRVGARPRSPHGDAVLYENDLPDHYP